MFKVQVHRGMANVKIMVLPSPRHFTKLCWRRSNNVAMQVRWDPPQKRTEWEALLRYTGLAWCPRSAVPLSQCSRLPRSGMHPGCCGTSTLMPKLLKRVKLENSIITIPFTTELNFKSALLKVKAGFNERYTILAVFPGSSHVCSDMAALCP